MPSPGSANVWHPGNPGTPPASACLPSSRRPCSAWSLPERIEAGSRPRIDLIARGRADWRVPRQSACEPGAFRGCGRRPPCPALSRMGRFEEHRTSGKALPEDALGAARFKLPSRVTSKHVGRARSDHGSAVLGLQGGHPPESRSRLGWNEIGDFGCHEVAALPPAMSRPPAARRDRGGSAESTTRSRPWRAVTPR
jgi:hypothetical protein